MANILIVDDSIIMRKNLKTILTQGGHNIVGEATNGLQAYNEYVTLKPDLITMDITMPVMDGISATKKIVSEFKEAKILIISALDQKNMVFEALENGAKHYIMKPIMPDKVLQVVNEVLMFDRFSDYSKEHVSKNEALKHMWYEIKESKEEIVELDKNLDEVVEERTKELQDANEKLKETLNELQYAQQKLVQSEKMAVLAGMVAGVAHEINTPVGICITAMSYLDEKINEMSSIYKENKMKKSDFEKFLNISEETTKATLINLTKASSLIRSFKQVATDQSSEEIRTFVLKKYLEDVLLSLKPELKKIKHKIVINCDENLSVTGYPGYISQIATNLVMNSIIHAYEGKEMTLTFNVTENEELILFEYSDDGKGMEEEVVAKVFDPFFTTNRGSGGTGLGMNIIYNIITQKLNGTIKCESQKGVGTAFIMNIPLKGWYAYNTHIAQQ